MSEETKFKAFRAYQDSQARKRAAKPLPTTCREAAARFREAAESAVYAADARESNARAEILEMFGDAPVPAQLLVDFDFTR